MVVCYLAGVVVREVGLGILRGDSGEQEGPPLLADAVMVVRPVGWSCLHPHFFIVSWHWLGQNIQTCLLTMHMGNVSHLNMLKRQLAQFLQRKLNR